MIGFGGLLLRQAHEALKTGRLDEAHRLLTQPEVQSNRKAWELTRQLMQALVERGEKHLTRDDAPSAWEDLLRAEQLGITDNAPVKLRQTLTRLGIAEVRALLEAGEPGRAGEVAAQLRGHGVRQPELTPLEDAARGWLQTREAEERGDFALALQTVERLRRIIGGRTLQQWETALVEKQRLLPELLVRLPEAAGREAWQEVLQISEQILALAPQHAEARRLRTKAWRAIEPPTLIQQPLRKAVEVGEAARESRNRFILWIDGLGGFLVCLDNRVSIGQATSTNRVDIPIQADLARTHAWILRDNEGYVLEPMRSVKVNGEVVERRLLQPGDLLQLGSSVELRFEQPVPISSTARLMLESSHRLRPALSGVVLMAETLVIGAGPQSHITFPDLHEPIILFRMRDGLGVRHTGSFSVGGEMVRDRAPLSPGATVSGSEWSITLEMLEG